ncbi:Uu.00g024620.m01.CDS01 [Anthostomella pinea]|uniref:Uu.00g024620.m01.CDS01 n=1 Tax=Anthostomella pinea TaxID=933095 RepID=A0AAI8YR34_9PEZI|nr:Uu.00g024620.m01.CDS01 [Anthostomella pinea]
MAASGDMMPKPLLKARHGWNYYPLGQYLRPPHDAFTSRLLSNWEPKQYSSLQVQIAPPAPGLPADLHPCLIGPTKVLVEGIECYFKEWSSQARPKCATAHELLMYKKIDVLAADEQLPAGLRVSKLHGVVIDDDDEIAQCYDPNRGDTSKEYPDPEPYSGSDADSDSDYCELGGKRLVGILIMYIDNIGTLADTAPWADCDDADRNRWARDIEALVTDLHDADLVWGDAKPHNVLVDRKKRDLWLIDFGGSFTRTWVDENKADTKQGDMQGVARIQEWLAKCSKQPISRISRS